MTVPDLVTKLTALLPEGFTLRVRPPPDAEAIISHGARHQAVKLPVFLAVTDEQAEDIIHEIEDFVRAEGHKPHGYA